MLRFGSWRCRQEDQAGAKKSMRSVEGYLDQAIEYDRLAKKAAKPSDRMKFTNLAEYYRYMAREHAKSLEVSSSTSDGSPAIRSGRPPNV